MSRKKGKSGQLRAQTTEPRDFFFFRAQGSEKCGKGWWRHFIWRSQRGEDKHAWALEESHAGGKPASLSLADICFQGNSGNGWTFWFLLTTDVYRQYRITSYPLRYRLPHKHKSPFSGFLELNLNIHCTSTTHVTTAAVMLYFLYFCNRAIKN